MRTFKNRKKLTPVNNKILPYVYGNIIVLIQASKMILPPVFRESRIMAFCKDKDASILKKSKEVFAEWCTDSNYPCLKVGKTMAVAFDLK